MSINELKRVASQVRRDIIRMVHGCQSGHPGGSLGATDLVTALYFDQMQIDPANFRMDGDGEDMFFLSNGHISPVFYSVMARRGYFTVDKGSVTVNGVSLTVCNPTEDTFQVAIIPYTMEHTNFCDIQVGTRVNLEFDILGKYIARLQQLQ